MGDIVSDDTAFSCPLCTGQLKIKVLSSSAKGGSKKLASTSNFLFPPPSGAQCLLVPNAPAPCAPPSVSVIDPGQSKVKIDGNKALGAGCKLQCAKSGLLTVASSGQSSARHDGASGGMAGIVNVGSMAVFPKKDAANDNNQEAANDENINPANDNKNRIDQTIESSRKKINNTKQHLKGGPKGELRAGARELKGEVVKFRRDGKPFNHVKEVNETQQKLKKAVDTLRRDVIANPKASPKQVKEAEKLVSRASKLLDKTEEFVPSQPMRQMSGRGG